MHTSSSYIKTLNTGEMEDKTMLSPETFPMNGGNGRYSYANNSTLQRNCFEDVKGMLEEAIAEKLTPTINNTTNPFKIADLGCSTGPNTFIAVQTIIDAVDLKQKSQGSSLEYHVFFSDHTINDFNTLFATLPPERNYYTAAVPGSFYTRLFPKASLHFVHSSYSLNWLSKVPEKVVDINSPSWNKGKILYAANSPKEVVEAFSAQYAKDLDSFLAARAQEIVGEGLMVFFIPGVEDGQERGGTTVSILYDLLGSRLMDMVKMGMVSEAKVDSFNLPLYFPFRKEVEMAVKRNGCFSIEKMEVKNFVPDENHLRTYYDGKAFSQHARASTEGVFKGHFGSDEIDHIFDDHYSKKIADSLSILKSSPNTHLFVVLKRNVDQPCMQWSLIDDVRIVGEPSRTQRIRYRDGPPFNPAYIQGIPYIQ